MLDPKVTTLLTLDRTGSFTKAAQELNLTQPAVSNHIRLLEKEFGVQIFKRGKRQLIPTEEGQILIKYARRLTAVYNSARQAVEDCHKRAKHLNIGITQTAGEMLMPKVMAMYCNEHPHVHINIQTDTIKNLYRRLELYELDMAIVEGILPSHNLESVLLDTDYLCLIVAPTHPFAQHGRVQLEELKNEKLILRPVGAGTRALFETCLHSHLETIRNFNVIMELDNISMIKDLVASNLGVSIMAHSACIQEIRQNRLVGVQIADTSMMREIHMVVQKDFAHADVLEDFKRIYNSL